jgi:hypothetical protein
MQLLSGDKQLPILSGIELLLTADQIFAWLKLSSYNNYNLVILSKHKIRNNAII